MAKILIVDDERAVAEGLACMLRPEGFLISIANNGTAALDLAKKERPDLILLDINMPGMDGGDVARSLTDDSETSHIPIVYVSGMVNEGEQNKIHGRVFISKATPSKMIIKQIKDVLGQAH